MRFIHTADVHLGAVPEGRTERSEELWRTFEALVGYCGTQKVDLLLIAGDLFHKSPALRELREVADLFCRIPQTKIVMIAGNHDYVDETAAALHFVWPEHVTMLPAGKISSVYFEELNTEVYGYSYEKPHIKEAVFDELKPQHEERINLLLAHGNAYAKADDYIPIDREKLAKARFDYVALGHIHKAEKFSERMAYCGSLEPLDRSEYGVHGCILGELQGKRDESGKETTLRTTFLGCAGREYKRLSYALTPESSVSALRQEVKKQIMLHGMQHFYTVVLCGKRGADWYLPEGGLADITQVIAVEDESKPFYDVEEMIKENRLAAAFVQQLEKQELSAEEKEKALHYGLNALQTAAGGVV